MHCFKCTLVKLPPISISVAVLLQCCEGICIAETILSNFVVDTVLITGTTIRVSYLLFSYPLSLSLCIEPHQKQVITRKARQISRTFHRHLSSSWSPHALYCGGSWDRAVNIMTGYGLDGWRLGVQVLAESRNFFSLHCPNRLWDPHSLLLNGYWGLFPGRKVAGTWNWPLTFN
jgi:hypothetical protein